VAKAETVTVAPTMVRPAPSHTKRSRVEMDDAIRARLDQYAYRTYVPETETSRLSGAGGGAVDDD
jgi:hypothetical protein